MLVFRSNFIVVFPDLIEVEGIKKLNRPIKGSGNEANVFDVFKLSDRIFDCLLGPMLFRSLPIGSFFTVELCGIKLCAKFFFFICVSTQVFKLVFQDGIKRGECCPFF